MVTMLVFMLLPVLLATASAEVPSSARSDAAIARVEASLSARLESQNLELGAAVYLRITKQPARLTAYIQSVDNQYVEFRSWDICTYSGGLGPKKSEGDGKSPEGFYNVSSEQMNPRSSFHLSFNLGFPNAFDRLQGYTGSYLMVHGRCASIGCYAMGDDAIEEIWTLMTHAFVGGQKNIPVHIFPFEISAKNLQNLSDHPSEPFWRQLAPAWQTFEATSIPPSVVVRGGRYVVAGTQ